VNNRTTQEYKKKVLQRLTELPTNEDKKSYLRGAIRVEACFGNAECTAFLIAQMKKIEG